MALRRFESSFFTATILEWKRLLKLPKYKDIILSSLRFLSEQERIYVQGFVIMDNHLHLLWHIRQPYERKDVQRDFLKYTAQQIKFDLQKNHPAVLSHFRVDAKDRQYQFWERNPLSVPVWTEAVLAQKLHYIHENPVRAGICALATEYHYSSARFYESGVDEFGFLRHYQFG